MRTLGPLKPRHRPGGFEYVLLLRDAVPREHRVGQMAADRLGPVAVETAIDHIADRRVPAMPELRANVDLAARRGLLPLPGSDGDTGPPPLTAIVSEAKDEIVRLTGREAEVLRNPNISRLPALGDLAG